MDLFDRKLLRQNRARAAKNFADHNFLYHEIAKRIAENVEFFNREFESLLELTARDGYLSSLINSSEKFASEDDEFLPFEPQSFDLILSNLNFHHLNQIPQFLLQVKDLLKQGGVFIASFFGEENLHELAHVLHQTECEIYGGISPRMPPMIDVKTAANLLLKAGFSNPISDFEKIEVSYSNPLNLLKDLKMMGQGNVMYQRSRRFFTKRFLAKISENYQKIYGKNSGEIPASFEIVTICGTR